VVLDIGANIGWYSILFGKKNPASKIYSFEPITESFNFLKKNLFENAVCNVEAINAGLSKNNGHDVFYYSSRGSVVASKRNLLYSARAKKILCKVMTLDSFSEEYDLSQIDLIKCDVEGGELDIFLGGLQTIQHKKPVVYTEMFHGWCTQFGYHPNDIIRIFLRLGYRCYYSSKKRLYQIENLDVEPAEERFNYFFFHEEKHKHFIKKFQE
jgi:FkbM family methyltransferase